MCFVCISNLSSVGLTRKMVECTDAEGHLRDRPGRYTSIEQAGGLPPQEMVYMHPKIVVISQDSGDTKQVKEGKLKTLLQF